ncbi:MAG TPA: serine/threonine-protein kinase [Pyrinomonadaceae bacterium]|jgi:non-specific serine/threonine protein kinase/serine/threonine-protein kinase
MKAKEWEKVKDIFNRAVELAPAERERFLASFQNGDAHVRREVEKLLAADENSDAQFEDFSFVSARNLKEKIGRYKILREIGAGGMGTVYLAEREDLAQKVALKIIRHGANSDVVVRRFRKEQEILAALEHANIARLLDVGLSDEGLPFLAMEYVEGSDLLAYCAENNLSLDAKLKLFRKICDAVAYAHSRLVVHRDLKPSNILVNAKGEPKLLDFGISKLLSEEGKEEKGTVTSFGMLTPNYASPEQFRGESVSTAADVYSLSVILYELLTGKLPYDVENRRYEEVARIVCETDPQKPSDILTQSRNQTETGGRRNTTDKGRFFKAYRTKGEGRSLKGDIDNILLKALRKEPERRYSSIEKFSDDLRRHLEGLPVTARPDTFFYRAEKFVRRNRFAVASSVLIILIFLAGVGGITWQYFRAERQRILAERRFADVRQLANNVVFKYHDEIQNLPGSTKAREMLVKDALVYLNRLALEEDAETSDVSLKLELAQAFMKIGDVQGQAYDANLGDTAGAVESYRKAVALLENAAAQKTDDLNIENELATSYQKISSLIGRAGNQRESFEFAEKAVALGERLAVANPQDNEQRLKLAGFYLYLGDNLPDEFGTEASIEIYQKGLRVAEAAYEIEPEKALSVRRVTALTQRIGFRNFLLAENAVASGNRARALEFYQISRTFYYRSNESAKKLFALDEQNAVYRRTLSSTKLNLSQAQRELGETDVALAAQREVLSEMSLVAESDAANIEAKNDLASVHDDIAQTLAKRGQFADAFDHFRQAHILQDTAIEKNPGSREFVISRYNSVTRLGNTLAASGDYEAAIRIYQSGFERIKHAPMLQDPASQAFYEGSSLEKIGDALAALAAMKNASADQRRAHLERARSAYQKVVELWRQPECWQTNFAKNAGKFDFVSKKLADL